MFVFFAFCFIVNFIGQSHKKNEDSITTIGDKLENIILIYICKSLYKYKKHLN